MKILHELIVELEGFFGSIFDMSEMEHPPYGALLILEGRDAGKVVPIKRLPFQIGRLMENSLVIADEQVSRNHARIEEGKNGLVLEDLNSRNGVFVDGRKIQRHSLLVGDRVRLGSTVLIFHTDIQVAKDVLADSIPDSPALAMEEEEVTSVEFTPAPPEEASGVEPFEQGLKGASQAFTQASRLFSSVLSPGRCASQLLDIFFQTIAPERAQILWKAEREISLARSRDQGLKCEPFRLPECVETLGEKEPLHLRTSVSVPYGSGSEERFIVACPLITENGTQGWLYGDRPLSNPFSEYAFLDCRTLAAISAGVLQRAAVFAENKRLQNQVLLMEKHLSPEVVRMLSNQGLKIDESALKVEKREVSILFSDIQDFTPLSERLDPESLANLLNEYFQRMVDEITIHKGMPNKFIGDAIMALFGAPETHGDDAVNAVNAGMGMLEALKGFWEEIDEQKRFHIRVGINTGVVVAGNIGSEKKMEYTVLGDEVNVASRLEGISPPDTLTIGARTAELVKDHFELKEVPGVQVKGKSTKINVYEVLGPKKIV